MRILFLLSFILATSSIIAQKPSEQELTIDDNKKYYSQKYEFQISLSEVRDALFNAPQSDRSKDEWSVISLPFPDGSYKDVKVAESSVFAEEMQNRYSEIRSYRIKSTGDEFISGRLAISPLGISGLVFTDEGDAFYEPISSEGLHKVYTPNRADRSEIQCTMDHRSKPKGTSIQTRDSYGGEEKIFRIAIAGTGEWSNKYSNNLTTINSKINEYLTELNAIYERDLAISVELIADNDDIIFFDPATDGLDPTNNSTKLSSAQSVISNIIPSADYELGHAFYEIPYGGSGYTGSGVAGLGVVCDSGSKARGWSGCGGNYPTSFWMDIFAHEVGHQFNAAHSFYGTANFCYGGNRSVGSGVEPGSGNSIMSYEGKCGANGSCSNQNIIPYVSSVYFHSFSIKQVHDYINSSGNCYSTTGISNSAPVLSMPSNYTIPSETPFVLSATATDSDGDALLLGWEEVDTDNLSLSCPDGAPNDAATSTTAPLFRSYDPSSSGGTRYFPKLNDILDDTQVMGEILPEVSRTIDMRFTARADAYGGVTYEDVTITSDDNSGPFEVMTANSSSGYTAFQNVNVEWDVANTDQAPVSCSHVNILYSLDGGQSFSMTLVSNTPNDGNEIVVVPNIETSFGRIKVEAVGNIFFDINNSDIVVSSSCSATSSTISNDEDVIADPGAPELDLDLLIGDAVTSFDEDVASSDPSTFFTVNNTSNNSCQTFSNYWPKYKTLVLQASEADTYNFSISGFWSATLNVYSGGFDNSNICNTWLGGSADYTPSSGALSFNNSISVTLEEYDVIELVVSGWASNNLGAFSIGISSNGTGELLETNNTPAGYTYKYVISESGGDIIEIKDDPDLSDASVYDGGEYIVEGIMLFGTPDLSAYINQPLSGLKTSITNGTICGLFSTNDVMVTVNGCTPSTKMITSAVDNGLPGSLSYEIENSCPGDMIVFSSSLMNQTIIVSEEIMITDSVQVAGLGKNNLTISGNNSIRVFSIEIEGQLLLSDIALKNGYSPSDGGAFLNDGAVTLDNVILEFNMSGSQNQAFTNNGTVTIISGTTEIKD